MKSFVLSTVLCVVVALAIVSAGCIMDIGLAGDTDAIGTPLDMATFDISRVDTEPVPPDAARMPDFAKRPTPPSCLRGASASTCGAERNKDCCTDMPVPGGTYLRSNDAKAPATVSSFALDRYEVTVGRFREFLAVDGGTTARPPARSDGAHPRIPGSGWDPAWNTSLASDTATLKKLLVCAPPHNTWTDVAGVGDSRAINCVSWYEAFAFCAWDGGWLPTEAEWNFAAAGGIEQRPYPWSVNVSDRTINATYAVYDTFGVMSAGSRSPNGDGRWQHADLAGNLWEWVLDGFADYQVPCVDCANLSFANDWKAFRGGAFSDSSSNLLTSVRQKFAPSRLNFVGIRCAR